MKTISKITFLLLVSSLLFASCSIDDDDNGANNFWIGYATVDLQEEGTSGGQGATNNTDKRIDFNLILDDETVMKIAVNNVYFPPETELEDGTRVIVNFTILEDRTSGSNKEYIIRLNAMKEVLSKKPVYSSQVEEEKLGKDPIDVEKSWFGGRYLNFTFYIWFDDSDVKHFINLWVDEDHPEADDDNIYVELRHNAYGEEMRERGYGRVSFDIREFIPAGKEKINVHFSYTNYEGKTMKDSGTYYRSNPQSGGNEVYANSDEMTNVF